MIITAPLRVNIGSVKKDRYFVLNMNQYRNTHYQLLNKAKIKYKELLKPQIELLPKYSVVALHYTMYPKNRQLQDIANVCSIHDKFFSDALVELRKLPDDNYLYLPTTTYNFGSVDTENPRVEIYIEDLSNA